MSEVFTIPETMTRALRLHRAGEYSQAEALYRAVLGQDPDCADAWHLLGLLAHQQGAHETALALINRAIQLNPRDAAYSTNLAQAHLALDAAEEAIAALRQAIILDPEIAVPRANLANVLYEQDRFEEALPVCLEALRCDPTSSQAWNILGNIHEARGRHAEAQSAYGRSIELDPTYSQSRANLGISLERCEAFAQARTAYEGAIQLDPSNADAHWNYALMLLKTGQFERGWQEYEWRWKRPSFTSPFRGFSQPLWEGQELSGRSILMHTEQGFGDALHFVRYAPLLAQRGARVILECPRELLRLFRTVEGVSEVIAAGDPFPEVDYQVPFLSIPKGFGTNVENIPAKVPYLRADPQASSAWRKRFEKNNFIVGLVWAGRPTPKGYNAGRSMSLEALAPIFEIPGLTFVSLQMGSGREQLEGSRFPVIDVAQEVEDFADVAAILSALDLLISVDTAAAHLAGALALPVWTLVPKPPAFQWMIGRDDSPWYPTMRLFRQEIEGQWQQPIARLAEALRGLPMV